MSHFSYVSLGLLLALQVKYGLKQFYYFNYTIIYIATYIILYVNIIVGILAKQVTADDTVQTKHVTYSCRKWIGLYIYSYMYVHTVDMVQTSCNLILVHDRPDALRITYYVFEHNSKACLLCSKLCF